MKKEFTYDGNESETYSIFRNGKLYMEVFAGEDDVMLIVQLLNSVTAHLQSK